MIRKGRNKRNVRRALWVLFTLSKSRWFSCLPFVHIFIFYNFTFIECFNKAQNILLQNFISQCLSCVTMHDKLYIILGIFGLAWMHWKHSIHSIATGFHAFFWWWEKCNIILAFDPLKNLLNIVADDENDLMFYPQFYYPQEWYINYRISALCLIIYHNFLKIFLRIPKIMSLSSFHGNVRWKVVALLDSMHKPNAENFFNLLTPAWRSHHMMRVGLDENVIY